MEQAMFINHTVQDAALAKKKLVSAPYRSPLLPPLIVGGVLLLLAPVMLGCRLYGIMLWLLILLFCLLLMAAIRAARLIFGCRGSNRTCVTFFEDRFCFSSDRTPDGITWSYGDIRCVVPSGKLITLVLSRTSVVLDKDGFEETDADAFLAFLAPRVPNNRRERGKQCVLAVVPTLAVILLYVLLTQFIMTSYKAERGPEESAASASAASAKYDLSPVIELVNRSAAYVPLKSADAHVFSLAEDLILDVTVWESPINGDYYLPVLVYTAEEKPVSAVLGMDVSALKENPDAANLPISRLFVQRIGPYTVINVGSTGFPDMKTGTLVPFDSVGTEPFFLSHERTAEADSSSGGWCYLPNIDDGRMLTSNVGVGAYCSYLFVLEEIPDDYVLTCGAWTLTAEEIRAALAHPYEGKSDTLYW